MYNLQVIACNFILDWHIAALSVSNQTPLLLSWAITSVVKGSLFNPAIDNDYAASMQQAKASNKTHHVVVFKLINLGLQSQSLCLQLVHLCTSNLELASKVLIDVKQIEFLGFQVLSQFGILNQQDLSSLLVPAGDHAQ